MANENTEELVQLRTEIGRLTNILNTPLYDDFIEAVRSEAAHQIWRWGKEHDEKKDPEDWFWTIGYLSGKALRAHIDHDKTKALHHTISTAAVLMHWHQAIQQTMATGHTPEPAPTRNTAPRRFFRQHLRLPLTVGAATASLTSALTAIISGTSRDDLLLMAAVAATSTAVPLAVAAITNWSKRRGNTTHRPPPASI